VRKVDPADGDPNDGDFTFEIVIRYPDLVIDQRPILFFLYDFFLVTFFCFNDALPLFLQ